MITQPIYFLQYENPYFTVDGASRGYSLNFREFDYSSFGLTDYNTASYGAAVSFGFPISEIQRIGFNIAADHTELQSGSLASREILIFSKVKVKFLIPLKLKLFGQELL